MLDALLATIGILGLLATIAAKRSRSCADAMARHAERDAQAPDPEAATGAGQPACPHRRRRKRRVR